MGEEMAMIGFEFGGERSPKFVGSYALPILPDFTPNQQDLAKAGKWIVSRIHDRTSSGRDVFDMPFAAYSPAYAKAKGSSVVDLRSPGPGPHTMDYLDSRTSSQGGASSLEVGFFGDERRATIARVMNEGGSWPTRVTSKDKRQRRRAKGSQKVPARYFLGLSPAELDTAQSIVVNSIKERNKA